MMSHPESISKQSNCHSDVSCTESKCSHTAPIIITYEFLFMILWLAKLTRSYRRPLPMTNRFSILSQPDYSMMTMMNLAYLVLVTMSKIDMTMNKGERFFFKLLQTNNHGIQWCRLPSMGWCHFYSKNMTGILQQV